MRDLLAQMRPDLKMPGKGAAAGDVAIAYCPERVLPGRILVELINNDRCIGGITPRCARKALTFYRQFVRGRSEEHTSELQSLMCISYAVFCLKQKNNNILRIKDNTHQQLQT